MSRFKSESNIGTTWAWMKKWNAMHANVGSAPGQLQPQGALQKPGDVCTCLIGDTLCVPEPRVGPAIEKGKLILIPFWKQKRKSVWLPEPSQI